MISIVIPTYREEKNLKELFKRIDSSLDGEYEIVLVDDDSPDGTAEKARELSETFPIRVFVREEDHGLSQSVIRGFQEAEGDEVVVMDADLQHPPEKIPELLGNLGAADIAVGSRFTDGETIEHWGLWRKFVNRTASLMYNVVYWRNRLSDPMSGFFAFKKDKVDVDSLDAEGFKILLEVLHRNELEVKEVPYRFGERSNGESSFNLSAAVEYVEQVGKFTLDRLGFKQSKRIVQVLEFMAVGGTGVVVNYLIFLPAIYYNLHYMLAGFLAFAGALQWNFFWNKTITFDKSQKSLWHQYKYFTLVNLGGLVVYQLLLFIL
ncbi:MAG: glycosyltransferase, partial [Candidatus Nanohalobium sp.]